MANYNNLKAAIQAVIKANGNQEITGDILQNVLMSMLNALSVGYQFVGIATPKTNPGTPDQKVFYIANGKGVYANFGGINVDEDEVVILTFDYTWKKLATGIQGGGGCSIDVDAALSTTSTNPVQNKIITTEILSMKKRLALLEDKVFPTTLSVSGGGTFDAGTTQTITVSWELKRNGQMITPESVTVNGESVDPATDYKVFTDVTATTTYKVVAVYEGRTYNGSTTATFKNTYYRYHGALPENTEIGGITADMVKGLTKEVCTGAAAVLLFTTENQRMAYAYPSAFGKLTTIKDTNLNAPFDDFLLESTLDVDGTEYYVYALTTPNFVTDYSVTFVK